MQMWEEIADVSQTARPPCNGCPKPPNREANHEWHPFIALGLIEVLDYLVRRVARTENKKYRTCYLSPCADHLMTRRRGP